MLKFTKQQLEQHNRKQVDAVIGAAGSIRHLAKMLNVNYMVVKGWKERGRISKGGVERITKHDILGEKFLAEEMRPDLFCKD